MREELEKKYANLLSIIKKADKMAVAFSGGVDSALLLYAAHEVLGEKVVAITVSTQSYPQHEADDVGRFLGEIEVRYITAEIDQLKIAGFTTNDEGRCYYCKKALFSEIVKIAEQEGIMVVADGSNVDDDNDYRPGMRAIKELGIKSPLKLAGLTKAEIRELSKEFGLFTWDKPSYACLASRIPYGEEITEEKLEMIEKSEQVLHNMGFKEVRVRCHGTLAKIEVAENDWVKVAENRKALADKFRTIGFAHVSIDLEPFISGNMNRIIINK